MTLTLTETQQRLQKTNFEALPKPPEEEQKFITENTLGLWWVDSEERFLYEPVLTPKEALIEKITEKTGWCIKSIKFCENRPHPLTSFK